VQHTVSKPGFIPNTATHSHTQHVRWETDDCADTKGYFKERGEILRIL